MAEATTHDNAMPADTEKNVAELDAAPDEASRRTLEAKLILPGAGPLDAAEQPSQAELAALDAAQPMDPNIPSHRVVRVAKGEVGTHESGDNHTKYGRWYGLDGQPWCDIFVSWVCHEVGQLKAIGGKHAYVPDHLAWFRKHKRFHHRGAKGGGPDMGGAIFFDWNGNGSPDHIGIVTGWTATHVYTVEGNRSDKVVAGKYSRSYRCILGYGYPIWVS